MMEEEEAVEEWNEEEEAADAPDAAMLVDAL